MRLDFPLRDQLSLLYNIELWEKGEMKIQEKIFWCYSRFCPGLQIDLLNQFKNSHGLSCKGKNSPFGDIHRERIVAMTLLKTMF